MGEGWEAELCQLGQGQALQGGGGDCQRLRVLPIGRAA